MIMKVEKEMKYEAPEVDILEVVVELGCAASVPAVVLRMSLCSQA